VGGIYESFYGLVERPFSTQPDPRYAYPSAEHQIAIAKMSYAADYRTGLALLTGPVGSGKTTVAHVLQTEWAKDNGKSVGFLPTASVRTRASFLRLILSSFGQETARYGADNQRFLEKFLIAEYDAGRHPILLIDEGQNVSAENIDTIAELTNFQTAQSKLITVILLAQDNLSNKLARKEAFRSRIAIIGHLDPLSFEEMTAMIGHRLSMAGARRIEDIFTGNALHAIYKTTRGIPRDICVLCDNALINGYVRDQRPLDAAVIERTTSEMMIEKRWPVDPPKKAPVIKPSTVNKMKTAKKDIK